LINGVTGNWELAKREKKEGEKGGWKKGEKGGKKVGEKSRLRRRKGVRKGVGERGKKERGQEMLAR
jgi:hypothetical protein